MTVNNVLKLPPVSRYQIERPPPCRFVLDSDLLSVLSLCPMSRTESQIAKTFDVAAAVDVSPDEWAHLTPEQLSKVSSSIAAAVPKRARVDLLNLDPEAELSIDQVNQLLINCTGQSMSNHAKDQIVSLIHEQQNSGATLSFNGTVCGISTVKRSDASTKRFTVQLTHGNRKRLVARAALPSGLKLTPKNP